jgi:hypothetical protein
MADYKYVSADTIDKNLICSICECPFIDPVIHKCGNTFCRGCLVTTKTPVLACPLCQETMALSLDSAPKLILNILGSLMVYCPSCGGQYQRDNLSDHQLSCPVPCQHGCGVAVAPKDQAEHDGICTDIIVCCDAADVGN